MATLTENVARVTSALDDIKNAIINKGGTITGKCETFASAINNIDIPKVATGTFNTTANGYTVNLGFVPKYIAVSTSGTTVQADTWFNGTYSGARGTGVNAGGSITTACITVSGTSFTHKAFNTNFASKTATYIAIG